MGRISGNVWHHGWLDDCRFEKSQSDAGIVALTFQQAKEAGRNRVHVSGINDDLVEEHRGEMRWVKRLILKLSSDEPLASLLHSLSVGKTLKLKLVLYQLGRCFRLLVADFFRDVSRQGLHVAGHQNQRKHQDA